MAVPEQTPYIEHTGNGSTTSFALGFQCETKDHLIVLMDGIEPPIASWSLTGGNVVFTTAPAAGKKITLQRNTPFSRTTDYQSYNNSFRPPAVNKDFDWIWWKLQELGVADWILGARIDALKNYVDRKDDELKAYLMEEIRKQGVALDQLDEYYNYLMQRLAQIAVDKGWDASFVVDGDKTQKQINNDLLTRSLNLRNYPRLENEEHDTPRINRMISKASGLGIRYCDIDDGDYYIVTGISDTSWYGLDSGIYLKSGVYVRASKGAKIHAIPNSFEGYTILRSRSEYDIGWFGGEFIGDRIEHTGTTGEWGHGLAIYGCERVFIDTKVSNCWGDGCLITSTYVNGGTQSKDVFLRLKADNNRRQGLSVTSVNGLYLLDGTRLDNTNGVNPQCGFDFEPNASQVVENVFVGDISCSGNAGGGGLIYASAAGSKVLNVNFNILNCSNNQNNGFTVRHVNVDGVTVKKLITSGNSADGFRADNNPKSITIKEHISTNDNRPASINICRDFNAYKLNWKNPVSSEGSFTSVIGGLVENIICDYVDKNYALSLYSCSGNFKIGTVTTKGSLKDAIYLYGTNDCDIGFDVSGSKSVSAITLNASSRNIIRGVTRDQALTVTTASAINLTNGSLNNIVEHNIIKPTNGTKWLYGVYVSTNSTGNKIMFNDIDASAYSSESIMDTSGLNIVEFNSGQFNPDLQTVTTAVLSSISSTVNTKYKKAGRIIFNTTTGKHYYSLGQTATDKWRPIGAVDNSQDITPTT